MVATAASMTARQAPDPIRIDKAADKWVQSTIKKMTLDENVGQLLVSSFQSTFMS